MAAKKKTSKTTTKTSAAAKAPTTADRVLAHLKERGGMTIKALSGQLELSEPAVRSAITKLQKTGDVLIPSGPVAKKAGRMFVAKLDPAPAPAKKGKRAKKSAAELEIARDAAAAEGKVLSPDGELLTPAQARKAAKAAAKAAKPAKKDGPREVRVGDPPARAALLIKLMIRKEGATRADMAAALKRAEKMDEGKAAKRVNTYLWRLGFGAWRLPEAGQKIWQSEDKKTFRVAKKGGSGWTHYTVTSNTKKLVAA